MGFSSLPTTETGRVLGSKLTFDLPPVISLQQIILSHEHILVHFDKFVNQRRGYHLDGKYVSDILVQAVSVDNAVGILQAIGILERFKL